MKSSPFLNLLNKKAYVQKQKGLFENYVSDKNLSFSKDLLNKGLLLTPHLKENFGSIYVCETGLKHIESDEIYIRESVIKQNDTDYKILDANLRIEKNNVPSQLINDLRTTKILFGSLLKKYGIEVTIENQEIIVIKNVDDSDTMRMGRSRTMVNKNTQEVICDVYELLNIEQYLFAAKNYVASA